MKIASENGLGAQFADYVRGVAEARGKNPGAFTKAVCSFVLTKEVVAHMAQQKPTIYQKAKALVGWVRDWLRRHGFANLAEYGETDVLHLLNGARKALRDPDGNGPKRGMTPTVLSVRKLPGAKNAKELLPSVLLNVQDDAGDAILAEPHATGNSGNLDTNEMPAVLRRGPVEALSEYVGTPEGRESLAERIALMFGRGSVKTRFGQTQLLHRLLAHVVAIPKFFPFNAAVS